MIKRSDFWCKFYFFFRKTDGFPLKVVNLRKNIEKRVIYPVLEKNKYIVVK